MFQPVAAANMCYVCLFQKRRSTKPSRSSETSTHRSRGRRLEYPNSGMGTFVEIDGIERQKNTPKSRTYSMTWISKQVILVIVFKFLAAARGLVQAGDCAVYLWATKGSNLVYKLGVGTRCGFCQISQQGFVNATFAVEKFVTVAHFL